METSISKTDSGRASGRMTGRSRHRWPALPVLTGLLFVSGPELPAAPILLADLTEKWLSKEQESHAKGWLPEDNRYENIVAAARGYRMRPPAPPSHSGQPGHPAFPAFSGPSFPGWCAPTGHPPSAPFPIGPGFPDEEGPSPVFGSIGGEHPAPPGPGGSMGPGEGSNPAVPEPGSLILLGAGMLGLWALRPSGKRKH